MQNEEENTQQFTEQEKQQVFRNSKQYVDRLNQLNTAADKGQNNRYAKAPYFSQPKNVGADSLKENRQQKDADTLKAEKMLHDDIVPKPEEDIPFDRVYGYHRLYLKEPVRIITVIVLILFIILCLMLLTQVITMDINRYAVENRVQH